MANKHTRDLTQGSVSQNILFLAWPMLITTILQNALNIVDMFWVGRLGAAAIAAVAFSGSILMVILTILIGVGTGTLAMVSRFVGAKDYTKASDVALQSLILCIIGSFFLAICGLLYEKEMLAALRAEPEVIIIGSGYLKIMLAASSVMFMLFLINSILQGAGNTYTPMVMMIIVTVVNAVLDPILIFGWLGLPKMGVNGAAIATVIAEVIGIIIGFKELFFGSSHIKLFFNNIRFDFGVMARIINIGFPSSLQMTFRSLMGIVMIGIVAGFGTVCVAAYGIGLRLQMMVLMPGFALGNAAATLVGQNLGAGKSKRAEYTAWVASLYYMGLMLICAIVFFIFAQRIIAIFNNSADIIQTGKIYLRISAFSYVFIALGVIMSRVLNGAGDTIGPMIITLVSLWGVQIPLALILARYYNIGINGIWWAINFAAILHGVLMLWWFLRGRWKYKSI